MMLDMILIWWFKSWNATPSYIIKPLKHIYKILIIYCGRYSIRYQNAELYDDNGDVVGYHEIENCIYEYHDKYDLHKTTHQIKTKKYICEALIRSFKFSAFNELIKIV